MTTPSPAPGLPAALRSVIDLNGPALLFEPDRLRRSLEAHCPDQASEIALLLAALEHQVPQSLLGAHTEEDLQRLMPQSIERLIATGAVEPGQARWAVATWAQAIKLQPAPVPLLADDPVFALRARPDGLLPRNARAGTGPRWLAIVALVVVAIAAAVSFSGGPGQSAVTEPIEPAFVDRIATGPIPQPVSPTPPPPAEATVPPPAITYIQLPQTVVTGKPFVVTVGYQASATPVDRIRAAVVDGPLKLGAESTRIEARVDAAAPGVASTLTVPFNPIAEAARGTLAITLIDAEGRESLPKSIALDVGAAPVRAVVENCTQATCGSVVAVRQRSDRTGGAYEVIIRMDDRTIHTVVQSTPWRPGSRVRLSAGRFVAMRSDAPR